MTLSNRKIVETFKNNNIQFKIENLTNGQTRLYYIDLLESIAIFLVLAYHGTNYEYGFLEDSKNVLFYLRDYFRTMLSCCVPLFFFANGYLLLNRAFNLKKHIIKIIKLTVLTGLWDVVWYGYDTIFTFINVFCIFSFCTKYKGKENLFRKVIILVSTNTLGIYFIHVLFSQLFIRYAREFSPISNIYGNLVYTAAIAFISMVFAGIIKKIPLLKRLVI